MQPLKVKIEGNYWDSYIYMGRLYLWTFDNDLYIIEWDKLISDFFRNKDEQFIAKVFTKSYIFESESIYDILLIDEVNETITRLFEDYSNLDFTIKKEDIENYTLRKQNNPFNNLTSGLEIFNKKIYAATEDGFFSASAHRSVSEKYLVSTKPIKLWDNKLFSLNASGFGQISLSGGDTGLYEYVENKQMFLTDLKRIEDNITQVSDQHSTFANYSFISLYNSSVVKEAELELFQWNEIKDEFSKQTRYERSFSRKLKEEEIFGSQKSNSLSWGVQDKIYRATDEGSLEVITFNNNADGDFFSETTNISLQKWKGKVIGGGVAHFGTIIECENALVILMNNDDFLNISNSVTKWRTFPRSKNYYNQLHVIQDDYLEIYAFHNDFLDQNNQNYRIKYYEKYLR